MSIIILKVYSFPKNIKIAHSDKFYFTCPSYGFITPILSIIDEIMPANPQIEIIVMNEQMRLFWQQLITSKSLSWNLVFLPTRPPGRFRNALSWLRIRPAIRKLYEKNFKSVAGAYFFCCGHGSDLILFSLVKMIASENKVIFLNIQTTETIRVLNLKALVLYLHNWVIYRLDITIRRFQFSEKPRVFLSKNFFKKLGAPFHEFKYFYCHNLLKKYNSIPSQYISGKKLLVLADTYLIYDKKKKEEIHNCLQEIKQTIGRNFSRSEVLYKLHPNSMFQREDIDKIFEEYEKMPSFMSADFIFSDSKIEFIIGSLSAALSTAAKHTDITAISYSKLMPFEKQKIKKKNMLDFWSEESDQKIRFIGSIEELDSIFRRDN
ncbi:hypothetical protein [Desulfospira joergensenii]|uniref:hypothetical protein n=1 Tax=Desulfospira joergensenii TaxID=53329 RepID=UPI0003B3438D|nr:hypothetical protein [Desulfospira joergensenii]